jgi:hypothetical protein
MECPATRRPNFVDIPAKIFFIPQLLLPPLLLQDPEPVRDLRRVAGARPVRRRRLGHHRPRPPRHDADADAVVPVLARVSSRVPRGGDEPRGVAAAAAAAAAAEPPQPDGQPSREGFPRRRRRESPRLHFLPVAIVGVPSRPVAAAWRCRRSMRFLSQRMPGLGGLDTNCSATMPRKKKRFFVQPSPSLGPSRARLPASFFASVSPFGHVRAERKSGREIPGRREFPSSPSLSDDRKDPSPARAPFSAARLAASAGTSRGAFVFSSRGRRRERAEQIRPS